MLETEQVFHGLSIQEDDEMQTDMSSSFMSDKSATSTSLSLKKAGEGRIVSLHGGPARPETRPH